MFLFTAIIFLSEFCIIKTILTPKISNIQQLTFQGTNILPQISKDGNYVAYIAKGEFYGSLCWQIYRIDLRDLKALPTRISSGGGIVNGFSFVGDSLDMFISVTVFYESLYYTEKCDIDFIERNYATYMSDPEPYHPRKSLYLLHINEYGNILNNTMIKLKDNSTKIIFGFNNNKIPSEQFGSPVVISYDTPIKAVLSLKTLDGFELYKMLSMNLDNFTEYIHFPILEKVLPDDIFKNQSHPDYMPSDYRMIDDSYLFYGSDILPSVPNQILHRKSFLYSKHNNTLIVYDGADNHGLILPRFVPGYYDVVSITEIYITENNTIQANVLFTEGNNGKYYKLDAINDSQSEMLMSSFSADGNKMVYVARNKFRFGNEQIYIADLTLGRKKDFEPKALRVNENRSFVKVTLFKGEEKFFTNLQQLTFSGVHRKAFFNRNATKIVYEAYDGSYNHSCYQIYELELKPNAKPRRLSSGIRSYELIGYAPYDDNIILITSNLESSASYIKASCNERLPPVISGLHYNLLKFNTMVFELNRFGNVISMNIVGSREINNTGDYALGRASLNIMVFTYPFGWLINKPSYLYAWDLKNGLKTFDREKRQMIVNNEQLKLSSISGSQSHLSFSPDASKAVYSAVYEEFLSSKPNRFIKRKSTSGVVVSWDEANLYIIHFPYSYKEENSTENKTLFWSNILRNWNTIQITNGHERTYMLPFYLNNGYQILYTSSIIRNNSTDIFIMNDDGTNYRQVTHNIEKNHVDSGMIMDSAGKKVLFRSSRNSKNNNDVNIFMADWIADE